MKRSVAFTLMMLLLVGLFTACGDNGKTEPVNVDLTAYYNALAEQYEWDETYMTELDDEMLDNYYPGLREITTKQFVARTPLMSFIVTEFVFMECETEEDATKAAAILQARIDTQAEGGAWYPESITSWEKSKVIQNGTYVALIASGDYQAEIEESYNKLFA